MEQRDLLQQQNAQLEDKIALMRKLGNHEGFYQHYWSILKDFNSRESAFEHLNQIYFDCFGEYRFSDYNSFRRSHNYHQNKIKKS